MLRQPQGGAFPDSATLETLLAAEQASAKKGAGAQDHRRSAEFRAIAQPQARHAIPGEDELGSLALDQLKPLMRRQHALDSRLEQRTIGLDARPPDGGPLGTVEHAVMDRRGVGRAADQPVEGVDLAHEMSLAEAADGGIAAHRADGRAIECHQGCTRAHTRSDGSGFTAGVAASHDDDVEFAHAAR